MGGKKRGLNSSKNSIDQHNRSKAEDTNSIDATQTVSSVVTTPTTASVASLLLQTPTSLSTVQKHVNSCNNGSITHITTPRLPTTHSALLTSQQEMSATRVFVRVRPFNQRERDLAATALEAGKDDSNIHSATYSSTSSLLSTAT
uniref:Centromere-associated protein E n=1 Tax=Lygus hesperus TaxID=30085 RepID=A0A0A9Z425_LYGHE